MTLETFNMDDKFIVRLKKNLLTNPDNSWVNTYEFVAVNSGSAGDLLAVALRVLDFEKLLHAPVVRFSQLTVSTWVPDSKPYDPTAFISTPLGDVGSRTKAVDMLPLNQTWGVTRVAATGRFGHLFLRGALYEDDVTAPAGKAVFSNLSALSLDLSAAISTSTLDGLFTAAPSEEVRMVMINKAGTQVRPIVGFSVGGVSSVPQDHAWFNRTTPTP